MKILFFFFSYSLWFIGILILCRNFNIDSEQILNNKSVSNWFGCLTSYNIVKSSGMNNLAYVIIYIKIFVLFAIRFALYGTTIYKINS